MRRVQDADMWYVITAVVAFLLGRFVRWTHRNDWKADAPTDRQLDFADELGIKVPRKCTKGQLSDLIDAAKSARG
jgi:hypothetical protein